MPIYSIEKSLDRQTLFDWGEFFTYAQIIIIIRRIMIPIDWNYEEIL